MMRFYPLLLLLVLSFYGLHAQQLVIPIADPADDLEELIADGSLDEGSSDLELGSEDADGSTPQIVGLRFVDIEIPEGAIITSAYLQFYVDEEKGNETTSDLVIYAENALDAAPFDASMPGNLSSRERVEMEIGWSVPSGNWMTVGLGGEDQQTPDISPLINILIDAGWQSGSAMVFMIEGTGTKAALSADNDFGLVTELVINYRTASDFSYQIADGLDDHEERISTGSMDANSSDLELGSEDGDGSTPQLVGLRFTDVNIPAGATIVDASIQFTVDESKSTEAASYTIQLENSPNPDAYTNDDASISSRMYMEAGVNWDVAANTWTMAGEAGDDQKTPNLAALVQAAIDQEGWEAGNAIAFCYFRYWYAGSRIL